MGKATQRLSAPWSGLTAVCIGNGRSRLQYDLGEFVRSGWRTIGCNGIHEDFEVDALVVVDAPKAYEVMFERPAPETMLRFVHDSQAGLKHPTVVPLRKAVRMACADGAGPASVAAAICLGASRVVLVGHDLDGKASTYHGTRNTAKNLPSFRGTVEHWRRTIESIMEAADGVEFVQLGTDRLSCPVVTMEWLA